eukprot:52994-Rhodomonas_salina.1
MMQKWYKFLDNFLQFPTDCESSPVSRRSSVPEFRFLCKFAALEYRVCIQKPSVPECPAAGYVNYPGTASLNSNHWHRAGRAMMRGRQTTVPP